MLPPFFFSVRVPTLLAIWWLRFRYTATGAGHKEPPSFIIYRLDSMGDVVLTTPILKALKGAFPKSRISVVVQSAYRSLLVTNPSVDEVLCIPSVKQKWLPKGFARLLVSLEFYWTQLRKRRFDYAVSPRWDADEHLATLLCVLANAARRVGYTCQTSAHKAATNRGFDAAFDICLPAGPVQHEVERNSRVAEALGAAAGERRLDIRLTDQDRRQVNNRLGTAPVNVPFVAIGIGAASAGRRWPIERYAETVKLLSRNVIVWPVIVCAREELQDALKLRAQLRGGASVVSGAALREVCAVLERCSLFLGNDSGCAHLAAAVGCPALVISRHPAHGDPNHFNSPVRFSPWGEHVVVLRPEIGRDTCRTACVIPSAHCILSVNASDVAAACTELLANTVAIEPRFAPAQYPQHSHSASTSTVALPTAAQPSPILQESSLV